MGSWRKEADYHDDAKSGQLSEEEVVDTMLGVARGK